MKSTNIYCIVLPIYHQSTTNITSSCKNDTPLFTVKKNEGNNRMIIYPQNWYDYSEILLIAIPIYVISGWLQKDTHTPLLGYAYLYGVIAFGAYTLQLQVILTLLPITTLLFFMFGLIIHQDMLQKNIVTHKHISYEELIEPQWIEHLLSSALATINPQKSVTIVIERTDSLRPFLITPFILKTKPHKALLDILLHAQTYDGTHMLWVQQNGLIISSQALWHHTQALSIDPTMHNDISLFYTQKTDALVCIVYQATRTCTLMIHGTSITNITMHNTHKLIQKYIQTSDKYTKEKEAAHETGI